ncbi:Sir2 silent information regulator family NAD-dependent deacetylase [Petralouisia muris]|uniref:Sir2 silent information regulator family NAD-dependent deacetylase n=1 Tax=Petralouisia muris TaxID=3032872 RepID=A0AC61RSG6_9FIRM|nr:Sir2 silent information regulator family NAD-dependent deacetylase [Petralouisia muris]TGY91970.1 Sir2 silent information regulator family NAD-dependent deacetylase [Petralouisia muris]
MSREMDKLKNALAEAEAVVIGAGAGLSASAGFTYSGERFEKYFGDFIEKYHISDMYAGGFYPYETLEEYWAWWSRHIYYNRYVDTPKPVYSRLHQLMKERNYFVLTTNVDHQFQRAGFDKKRLFYTQGDYGLWQCSKACHNKTYDNEETVRSMISEQKEMKVPSELVPSCPVCGAPMTMNLRQDDLFVQDAGWHSAAERYREFIQNYKNRRILFLELGVGGNTPGIIKYPFWHMVNEWKNAQYICINAKEAYAPEEIKDRSICIQADIGEVLCQLDIYGKQQIQKLHINSCFFDNE